jgi:hypothetical protein
MGGRVQPVMFVLETSFVGGRGGDFDWGACVRKGE